MLSKCEKCIWADQCGEEHACEDYTPYDDSELAVKEYIEELKSRTDYYYRNIQNKYNEVV